MGLEGDRRYCQVDRQDTRGSETGALQLSPEDDCKHGEADGHGQTQVQVQEDGAEEGDQPHQLEGSRGQSAVDFTLV